MSRDTRSGAKKELTYFTGSTRVVVYDLHEKDVKSQGVLCLTKTGDLSLEIHLRVS
jgi:hypothetical protein